MVYRLNLDVSFKTEQECLDFIDKVKADKTIVPAFTSSVVEARPLGCFYSKSYGDERIGKANDGFVIVSIKKGD